MTKTPKPETESDLEREYHRNRSRKRKNSKQLNLPYGNLIIMNLKNSSQRIELGETSKEQMEEVRGQRGIAPAPWGVGSPSLLPPANRNATANANARGGGCARTSTSFWGPAPLVLFSLGIEKTDKFTTYYLPAPRPSSSALFQRVCLAWD